MANPSVTAESDPAEIRLALLLLPKLLGEVSRAGFLDLVLPELLAVVNSESGGLVVQRSGRWHQERWIGEEIRVPESLIGNAIDQGLTQFSDRWCMAPLLIQGDADKLAMAAPPPACALVLRMPESTDEAHDRGPEVGDRAGEARRRATRIQKAADLLAAALRKIEIRDQRVLRIQQLTDVLEAAAEWQRLEDDDALLRRIADTATRLLNCERSSIFLWDRRRKKLIGRPALGVEGKPLEVDDDAGVVGEVLRSGEAKIWNASSDDESRVNRDVDRSLEFETRSLVAVGMEGQRNELIGVFEAINHNEGGFDAFDAAVLADLATHAAVAIQTQRTRRQLTESRDRLVEDAASATCFIGDDPAIQSIRESAAKVAKTNLTVLLLGKNGTGKEVLAKHIHFESDRRSGPFIAVNCAALVETLLESELFGHEKGAFTDANQTHVGKFELASGGTLFLDEVGDMSPGGQAKLLRVLEEKVVVRVGGSQPIPVDVRVIAATNQPLEELIQQRRFREDLFFRLNVVKLTLPPLSQRGEDVLLLATHFLDQFCYKIGRAVPVFDSSARAALKSHSWPGNIRELRNTIERIAYLCSDSVIHVEELMLSGPGSEVSPSRGETIGTLSDATKDFQAEHIHRAIDACRGNMTDAAARLGLHRSNLYRKMRQLGLPTSEE